MTQFTDLVKKRRTSYAIGNNTRGYYTTNLSMFDIEPFLFPSVKYCTTEIRF